MIKSNKTFILKIHHGSIATCFILNYSLQCTSLHFINTSLSLIKVYILCQDICTHFDENENYITEQSEILDVYLFVNDGELS